MAACGHFASTFVATLAQKGRRLKAGLFDSYHPELHYMRGPGPKWREKHGLPPEQGHTGNFGLSDLSRAGT
jgi:hypothetical protein